MLKKSTVFNFLYIFQLIQKVLTSNFLNLVLNIHICLYKNSKILFLLEKNNFQVKISTFFFSQTPKSKAIFGIFVPSCPKSARNKVYQINLNFSKIQSAAMSVDVSLISKKRITVQQGDFYLQNFGLSKSLSNHLKIYIHGSQNWFQNDSRSK